MPSLFYNGPAPDDTEPRGVQSRSQVEDLLNTGITREYVDGRATAIATPKATKTYVDTQDALYAEVAYYQAQDALLVPNASKGQVNGVASLDSSGKIPLTQIPVLGAGVLKGPYGLTSVSTGTASSTPLKIAEINIGQSGVNFKPLTFLLALVTPSLRGRPVVEIRIGDNTQTNYADQTLVASAFGRANYDDLQPVLVRPDPGMLNAMQDGVQTYYGPNTQYKLTAWLFDSTGSGQITIASGGVVSASAYLLRVVQ